MILSILQNYLKRRWRLTNSLAAKTGTFIAIARPRVS
jgi:hypothetical protein